MPIYNGLCLIIAHAGNKINGLLTNAKLIFDAKSRDNRDYRIEMNGDVFRELNEYTVMLI